MILSYLWPPRGAVVVFALMLFLAACSGRFDAEGAPPPETRHAFRAAQAAALVLYDAMAPAFGEGGAGVAYAQSLGGVPGDTLDCDTRYAAEALLTRCALFQAAAAKFQTPLDNDEDLASVIAALRADAPTLFALGRAAEVRSLQAIDFEWLAKMDGVFDGVKDRAPPQSVTAARQFRDLALRVERMLARPEPAFGAASPYEVMRDDGQPLTGADLAQLSRAITEAEAILRRFDHSAARWRGIAATLSDYVAMLAATQERLDVAAASPSRIDPIRHYAAALVDRLSLLGSFK